LSALPAKAAFCGNGKHIFVRQATSDPQWGVRAKVSTDYNTLETQACGGVVFITAHLDNCSGWCGTQVETGTRQVPNQFIFFAEKENSGGTTLTEMALVNPNGFALVRVQGEDRGYPTVRYHMQYNQLDSLGWHEGETFTVSWGTGWPMGETEKKGDGTTMNSKHRNLMYQTNSSGAESDWTGMNCVVDEAQGWHWNPLNGSSNDYDVVSGSAGSC
jgi:hypothetical protein